MHRVLGIGHWLLSTSLPCPHPNTHTRFIVFSFFSVCSIVRPPPPKRPIPPELEALIRLQHKSGQWRPSAEVHHCLGDYVPDPPDGVAEARWLTALCIVFIKCVSRWVVRQQRLLNRGPSPIFYLSVVVHQQCLRIRRCP